jgi:hypothetical protein
VDVDFAEFDDDGVVEGADEADEAVLEGEVGAGGAGAADAGVEGGAEHVGGGFGVDFAGAHDEAGGVGPAGEEGFDLLLEGVVDRVFGGAEAAGGVIAEEAFGGLVDEGSGEEEGVAVEEDVKVLYGGGLDIGSDGGFDFGGLAGGEGAGGGGGWLSAGGGMTRAS